MALVGNYALVTGDNAVVNVDSVWRQIDRLLEERHGLVTNDPEYSLPINVESW